MFLTKKDAVFTFHCIYQVKNHSDMKWNKNTLLLFLLVLGEFYQFNLSSCIRQQNSLTAQFVSFSLSNLANIFYPPQFLQ